MNAENSARPPFLLGVEVFALLLIIVLGLWARINDLNEWKSAPRIAFHQGEPLLATYDGYFYLTLARDLLEDRYERIDELRSVPDHPLRPSPPPLLSVLAAGIAKLTRISLNWIGVILPAVLGTLVALPLYGLGRLFRGPVMGLSSALLGVLPAAYVYRSSLGRFDTDCLIVTLTMSGIFFFLRFAEEKGRRRYLFLVAGLLNYAIFLWWWDQATHVVTPISLFPLLVALVFHYRPPRPEALVLLSLFCAGTLLVLTITGWDVLQQILRSIMSAHGYLSKAPVGDFPNMGLSVSEQGRHSFALIMERAAGSWPVFVLSIGGLFLLLRERPTKFIFLSVPILLGGLSFSSASRFEMFLGPVCALGGGFLVSEIWQRRTRSLLAVPAALVLTGLAAGSMIHGYHRTTNWPPIHPSTVQGMELAQSKTPPESVLWTTWGYGYAINYWARRATMNDGQVHTGERTVYNFIPFATDDSRLAANFIQFFSKHGTAGIQNFYRSLGDDDARGLSLIKEILAAGPQAGEEILASHDLAPVGQLNTTSDWLDFFFPADAPPSFIFLHRKMPATSYWWFWFGSWDIERLDGTHPSRATFRNISIRGTEIRGSSGLVADLENGLVRYQGREIRIGRAVIHEGLKTREYDFSDGGSEELKVLLPTRFAVLQEGKLARSVFSNLYYSESGPSRYFRPVELKRPAYQLWEVTGDSFTGAHPSPDTRHRESDPPAEFRFDE
ncbi:MAG: hypothetical protein CL933_02125 [Deltaproteobacteria bacterium]|nr:hypothetical protein [Deltaproteobacteria bacterium]